MRSHRSASAFGTLGLVLLVAVAAATAAVAVSTEKTLIAATIGVALLVPAGALLSGNPRLFCLWGLVLTAPIEFSKYFLSIPHMGGEYALRVELSDPFLAVLCLYWFGDIVTRYRGRISLPRPAVYWILLLIMAGGAVIFGTWRTAAGLEVVRMTKVLLLCLLIANEVRRPRQLKHIAMALVAGIIVQAVFGIIQMKTGADLGLERLAESGVMEETVGAEEAQRIGALMGHPNILSCYLAMTLPMAVSLLFARVSAFAKTICTAAVILGLVVLVATLSRNGWLSFGVALLIVFLMTGTHRVIGHRYRLLRWSVVAGLVVGGTIFSQALLHRLTQSDPTNISMRWELNNVAWKMVKDRPVFGFGKNAMAFERARDRQYQIPVVDSHRDHEDIPPIHNIYMQQWAEQGTVGLVIFLLMLFSILRLGVRNARDKRDPFLFAVNAGAVAGVVALMIHGMGDWAFWWNGIMRVFWILTGMIVAIRYMQWRSSRMTTPGGPVEPAGDTA